VSAGSDPFGNTATAACVVMADEAFAAYTPNLEYETCGIKTRLAMARTVCTNPRWR
jgi:hypothetical protein